MLALTKIADAFTGEDDSGDMDPPVQQMPDHKKKEHPVDIRMAQEKETTRVTKRKSRRKVEAFDMRPPMDMAKILSQALIITMGFAIHTLCISVVDNYINGNFVTPWNQFYLRLSYPIAIGLVVLYVRRRASA